MSSQIESQRSQNVRLDPFPFIDGNPAAQKSIRDRELEHAKVRAYAATAGHRRQHTVKAFSKSSRSVRDHGRPSRTPRCSPTSSQGPSPPSSTEDADEAEAAESRSIVEQQYHINGLAVRTRHARGGRSKSHISAPSATMFRFEKVQRPGISTSPHPGFGSLKGELFSAIANGEYTKVEELVGFYTSYLTSAKDLVTEMFDVTNIYFTVVHLLNCPLFYDAGLAFMGACREQFIDTDAALSTSTLELKSRSMKNVRLHLQRQDWRSPGQREGLISAIIFLALFEANRGNPGTAFQHMHGLKRIINALGGLQSLPILDEFQERTHVLFFESSFAMLRGASLFAKHRRPWQPYYPEHPFTGQLQALFDELPFGFRGLLLERKLSFDTIKVLQRAVKLRIDRNTAAQQEARARRRGDKRMYADFIEACPVLMMPDADEIMPEKLLCLALIIYCFISFDTVRSRLSIFRSSRTVLSKGVRTFQPRTTAERRLVLWTSMIAVDSHRTGAGKAEVTEEGATLLRGLLCTFADISASAASGWKGVRSVLGEFFWTTELDKFWNRSWDHLTGSV